MAAYRFARSWHGKRRRQERGALVAQLVEPQVEVQKRIVFSKPSRHVPPSFPVDLVVCQVERRDDTVFAQELAEQPQPFVVRQ